MLAIGIDPGTRHLGWGVVLRQGSRLLHVAHGVIDVDPKLSLARRMIVIAEELDVVLDRHRPVVGSVETLFFHKDATAAAKLGHARGVVLLCLARAGLDVAEYAPARVKRTLTGNGRAEKLQVAEMIRAVLALRDLPRSDAADALALAVTHLRAGPIALRVVEAPRRPARSAEARLERLVREQRARQPQRAGPKR